MEPKNPDWASKVRRLFEVTPFMRDLGVEIANVSVGSCETRLELAPKHLQQNGYLHAGVSAAMADHTCGGAAGTLVAPDEGVLTTEYSIHFLRAGRGRRLRCLATVLKPGSRLTVVEASVHCGDEESETLVAKMTATMAIVRGVAY